MDPKKPNKFEATARRARVAALYRQGKAQIAIAAELGVSNATITRDLKVIHQEWIKEAVRDYNEVKGRELARIDWIESEATEAWLESKKESEITNVKADGAMVDGAFRPGGKVERSIKKIKRTGNADYLAQIAWCIDARCKIFGLYAPTRVEVSELDKAIEEELRRRSGKTDDAELASDYQM